MQPTPDARELLRDVMKEIIMATRFKAFALVAALAGTSSTAMAQYAVQAPGYPSNPVSGAAVGEMNGAANGAAEAGPVGAIVGGAIGTATGALAGTANALAGAPPACAWGYTYYNGACYRVR
jgi:hypothetical protein